MERQTVRVLFKPMNREIDVRKGTSILESAREAGVRIENVCGGKGQCGKCRVIVTSGDTRILPDYDLRMRFLSDEEVSEGHRLACRTLALSDCEVLVPLESMITQPKILTYTAITASEIAPASRKLAVDIPSFVERALFSTRLGELVGEQLACSDEAISKLQLHQGRRAILTITQGFRGNEVIDVEDIDQAPRNYGFAVDLGTTTIVASLVNLLNGRVLDQASEMNRQIIYGEELISRIEYGSRPSGLVRLRNAAVDCFNELFSTLMARNSVQPHQVTDISVGGNTVMNHILASNSPSYLSAAQANVPREPVILTAKELGIRTHPSSYVYCLPNVSRFLGGDAVGDVLASGMWNSEDVSLLVDLGTNGEIIFGNNDWLFSCSVASGPAFEGGGVKFGMRAMRGGIEHVNIDPETKRTRYSTIDGASPRGICGSGMIDLVAEMFSNGILDFSGKIRQREQNQLVRQGREGLEYMVVPSNESETGKDIVITQKDLDYVLDSKASLCGAISTLMGKLKLGIEDINHLYLAGAFSHYSDLRNAFKIGVFPELPNAGLTRLGNGSLAGAYLALVSTKNRDHAKRIAKTMVYVDLLMDNDFFREYEAALYIPGKRELFPSTQVKIPK